jgi:hypothetical protein
MARIPISLVEDGSRRNGQASDEIRRLREHALSLVKVARKVIDPDLSAELDVIAIEVLTSAAKLERNNSGPEKRKNA